VATHPGATLVQRRDNVHNLRSWTFPDGTVGADRFAADLFAARHRFHQIWID
jgi:hypothetical protein